MPRTAEGCSRSAFDPTDRDNAIIAMQFGGMWKTYNAGDAWFRVYTLPAVHVTDVEYGADGKTVVATVFRDDQTQPGGGGGVYVSRTNGDFWSRPATGIVPPNPWTAAPTSAYSVSRAPDERGLWYVGTDSGVAISRDDGTSWTHINPGGASPVQSVLAFPGGSVLAMDAGQVWRSDDRGSTWRAVIADDFSQNAPMGGNVGLGGNKMDRSPLHPWALIMRTPARAEKWIRQAVVLRTRYGYQDTPGAPARPVPGSIRPRIEGRFVRRESHQSVGRHRVGWLLRDPRRCGRDARASLDG